MLNDFTNPLDFQQPQSLISFEEERPYPRESLPPTIKDAVDEAHQYIKAPYPMLATAALSAISTAIQMHFDVVRSNKLSGPSSLFTLTVAHSGERKSTCDGVFSEPIHIYESQQAELAKLDTKLYKANQASWQAKVSGISEKIKYLAKGGKKTGEANSGYYERELEKLMRDEPKAPKFPRLTYSDTTAEALTTSLYKNWPAGSITSSEAGIVFGSHSMKGDSLMMNLGILNTFWDGGSIRIERKTSESFQLRGARLSISLQVQEATLRAFNESSGELARGTGFFARFLLAWPASTQGTRFFEEPPENSPKLNLFHEKLNKILNKDAPINKNGELEPKKIRLSNPAKEAWKAFYNRIELMLKVGGELSDVRDVASKIADNAVRLACNLQMFCEPESSEIDLSHLNSGCALAEWHLNESKRFFGELVLSPEELKIAQLDRWLVKYCDQRNIERVLKSDILQKGPNSLRKKVPLDKALEELISKSRIALATEGKTQWVYVNPQLLQCNKREIPIENF